MSTETTHDKDEQIMAEFNCLAEKLKGYVKELHDDDDNCTPQETERIKVIINQTTDDLRRLDELLDQLSDEA